MKERKNNNKDEKEERKMKERITDKKEKTNKK